MYYIFILGRNVELSKAEVFSYFEKENWEIINYSLRKNVLLIETDNKLENIIDNLGGVISIGEVLASGEIDKLIDSLNEKELYLGAKNKFNYLLWDFSDNISKEFVSDYLKNRFRKEKLKTTEKHAGSFIDLQGEESVKNISSKRLIDEQFFIFGHNRKYFFGKIIQKYDYEKIESRDMNKPIRRQELAISPRLAKIMINLSGVRRDEKLLDPFCGIGVILEEALSQKIKVIGFDKDKDAVLGAEKNLRWFGFDKSNYEIINGNSKRISVEKCNVIVTEPFLGEILKKMPAEERANKIIKEFEKLIIAVINNLKDKISKRIVFTAPLINTIKGRVSCNINNILNKTRLKLANFDNIKFPIQEFRDDQIVGREIFVMEKS